MADQKTKYQELSNQMRTRMQQFNAHSTRFRETIAQLNQQVKDLTAEKERLSTQAQTTTPDAGKSSETSAELELLKAKVDALTREKAEAEKALSEQIQKTDKLIAENKAALVSWFFVPYTLMYLTVS